MSSYSIVHNSFWPFITLMDSLRQTSISGFWWYWGWLMLTKHVLYHLNNFASPFCTGYFGDWVLLYVLDSMDHNPTCISWTTGDDRHKSPCPLVEMGLLTFCPGWPLTKILLSSQDCRLGPLCQVKYNFNSLKTSEILSVGWNFWMPMQTKTHF
jgi:hypothetical protein